MVEQGAGGAWRGLGAEASDVSRCLCARTTRLGLPRQLCLLLPGQSLSAVRTPTDSPVSPSLTLSPLTNGAPHPSPRQSLPLRPPRPQTQRPRHRPLPRSRFRPLRHQPSPLHEAHSLVDKVDADAKAGRRGEGSRWSAWRMYDCERGFVRMQTSALSWKRRRGRGGGRRNPRCDAAAVVLTLRFRGFLLA